MQKRATNSVNLEKVFQCYVIASLVSTSGVDVLLLLTLLFLMFVCIRRTLALFGRAYPLLPWVTNPTG